MQTKITFKNLEGSDGIKSIIEKKMKHLAKYDHNKNSHVNWVCSIDSKAHCVEADVHMENRSFYAKALSNDMYKSIDEVISKIETQLQKHNDKRATHLSNIKNML
ncbi:MAG: ribosome-associated translation inhibitor RaiA [Bacteriovoracaceae bacterium]|jgi:putative sigma-54 modulation protein|nr:ribosome-associated translation inhibitor RaiA [Bacteriovoracaceae bacterium]